MWICLLAPRIPSISSGVMENIDVATLTQALAERDQEVKTLEAEPAEKKGGCFVFW